MYGSIKYLRPLWTGNCHNNLHQLWFPSISSGPISVIAISHPTDRFPVCNNAASLTNSKVSFVELPEKTKKGVASRILDETQDPELTAAMIDDMYDFYIIGKDEANGRTLKYVPKNVKINKDTGVKD